MLEPTEYIVSLSQTWRLQVQTHSCAVPHEGIRVPNIVELVVIYPSIVSLSRALASRTGDGDQQ